MKELVKIQNPLLKTGLKINELLFNSNHYVNHLHGTML